MKLALREMRGSKEFTFFFILNLSLGLCGLLTLETLRQSVDGHFQERARAILGGDIQVEVDGRNFTTEDIEDINKVLPAGTLTRSEKRFLTMATHAEQTRLVDVQAVDDKFPFYSSLTLESGGVITAGSASPLLNAPNIWIYPELAVQLGVSKGDEISLGGVPFRIVDFVTDDAALSSAGLATAPKVIVGIPQIAGLGFFEKGSRYEDSRFFKLPENSPPVEDLARTLERTSRARDFDVDVFSESAGRTGRFWKVLGDYLTLISLVALFLAGVGASYLFRGYLDRKMSEIAILMSVGANIWTVRAIYCLQLILLALSASAGALLFAMLIIPALPLVFGNLLPNALGLTLPLRSIILTILVAILTSIFVALPLLVRLGQVKPAALFRESGGFGRLELGRAEALSYVPAIVFYWGLAVWQANSMRIGSAFLGVFAASMLGLLLFGAICWPPLVKFGRSRVVPLKLAALNLTRHKLASITCFLAIGAGVLLAGIIPQIRSILDQELSGESKTSYPSLFMVDLQADQVEDVRSALKAFDSDFQNLSPMVRARLLKINDKPVHTPSEADALSADIDRQERRRIRRLSRGYNLTYGSVVKTSEEIVAGRAFDTGNEKPQISIEQDFAADIGVNLGDTMTFDVSGFAITGEVVSFRRIKWSSFQPNFFVTFSSGHLEEAPQTFVATMPPIPSTSRVAVQNAIVKKFPNISIIDVTQTIERILVVVETITTAMVFMAALTLIAAVAVLISISRFNAEARRPQTALLKVLGARFATVRATAAWEFLTLGFLASLSGSFLSIGAAYALSYVIFDRLWVFSWQWPLGMIVLTPLLCAAAGLLAAGSALKERPKQLLSD